MRIGWNGLRFLVPIMILACSSDPLGPSASTSSRLGPGVPRRLSAAAVNGKIAFRSDRDGNEEIYVMNADGTGQTRLTNHAASDGYPAWSPDGTKIAFASERDGNSEIYVMNADGTGPTRLTNHAAFDFGPAWSPDGTKIAFVSLRDGNFEIYVMNADGTGQTNLTNHAAGDEKPAWSPDGTKIAFASSRDGNEEIYVMNADGTGPTNLTNHAADDIEPSWSPDGTKIAFVSRRDGNFEIYVMNADGTGPTNLTNHAAAERVPAWSPDGTKIAFVSTRDGNFEIYVMNADGTGPTNLTNHAAFEFHPSWGPEPADADGDGIPDADDNCPTAANPDQSDLDQDGIGDVCEESDGTAKGNGTVLHDPGSERPGTSARFSFSLTAESPPSGVIQYTPAGSKPFRGGGTDGTIDYLEVEEDGTIYAAGTGKFNREPNWGFCMIAEDVSPVGKQGDRLEIRLWKLGAAGQGCPTPKYRFFGPLTAGNVVAES